MKYTDPQLLRSPNFRANVVSIQEFKAPSTRRHKFRAGQRCRLVGGAGRSDSQVGPQPVLQMKTKTKPQKVWLYWFRVYNPEANHTWINFDLLGSAHSINRFREFARGRGWKVGRVHRMRVTLPAEVLK